MSGRRWLARLELVWWMSRTYTDTIPLVLTSAAWLAAGGAADWRRHLLLLGAMLPFAGAGMVLNDIRDREKDDVTAPFMPLPAGLMQPAAARGVVLGLVGLALALLWLACQSAGQMLGASAALVATVLSAFGYSALKPIGIAASLFIGLPYVGAVAVATIVQGGPGSGVVGSVVGGGMAGGVGGISTDTWLLALFAWVYGCHSNVGTAMYDMDLDRRVGNRTVPVRLRARGAWLVLLAGAVAGWLLALAMLRRHDDAGVTAYALWAISVALALATLPRMIRSTMRPRTRLERIDDLAPVLWIDLIKHSALVSLFVPWLGIVYAIGTIALNTAGERAFRRRIVQRGIARHLGVPAPGGGAPPVNLATRV